MKKKLTTLLSLIFSFIVVLSGCNLFDTNNYLALKSPVAKSGNITITREEMINGYNSGGYYYSSVYGLSMQDSFKRIIDELINEEYFNNYINSIDDNLYKLSAQDYSDVVSNTWSYIDQALSVYVDEVRDIYGLSKSEVSTEETKEPEFAVKASYESKFELLDDGRIAYIEPLDTTTHSLNKNFSSQEEALEYAKSNYNYKKQIAGSNNDYKTMAWRKYISALKSSQSRYNYQDMSESAVFNREVERIFDYLLKSAKQTKFQEQTTLSTNFDYDKETGRYILNENALNSMVAYYKDVYVKNFDKYSNAKKTFTTDLIGTTNRANYVYYGDKSDETFITCTHILIKLSEDQLSDIKEAQSNKLYQGDTLNNLLNNIKSADNTYAYERSLTTGEVVDSEGISVQTLYNNLEDDLKNLNSIEEKTQVFNDYLYKYNVDTGIINAQFDYVVGTNNSSMVQTFTDAVRSLYDNGNGKVGSIAMVYEENDNYSGYHIVMYTGTLDNHFESKTDLENLNSTNIYSVLNNEYTSLSYNQTMFEFIYDKIAKDNFSTYKNNLIASLVNGTTTEYITSNYSDLYSN